MQDQNQQHDVLGHRKGSDIKGERVENGVSPPTNALPPCAATVAVCGNLPPT